MRWHRLRPNHGNRTPGALVCVDTESTERKGEVDRGTAVYPLRLGVARYCRVHNGRVNRRDSCRFTDAETFWAWLRDHMDPRRTLWLWAHNLGWDLCVLRFWHELESGRFRLVGPERRVQDPKTREWKKVPTQGLLITSDPPTALRCWDSRLYPLRGCDTFNWYRCSLKTLGHTVGLEKMEFPGVAGTDAELWPYCERDCEIVERAVLELVGLVKRHQLGNLRFTPAAQALSAYRHDLGGIDIAFNPDPAVAEFERHSYYGGRKAVFFAGEVVSPGSFELSNGPRHAALPPREYSGPVHHLDLTAAYASVMRQNLYPCQLLYKRAGQRPDQLRKEMKDLGACAWVLIESHDTPYPKRHKGRTWWYTGTFQTGLCGPELARALDLGHVQWVYLSYNYRLAELFTRFVDTMTRVEQLYSREADPVRRDLVKSIRNSLYGKFGQRSTGWELVPDKVADKPWGEYLWQPGPELPCEKRRSVAWRVQKRIDGPVVEWTFPAISAYVSAYCRERMRELREAAGPKCVYYQDADALHVSQLGADRLRRAGLISQNQPGLLREVAVSDSVHYFAPKWYRWGETVVNAGLHRNAVALGGGRFEVQDFLRLDAQLSVTPPAGGVVVTKQIHAPVHELAAERTPSGWTTPLRWVAPTTDDG